MPCATSIQNMAIKAGIMGNRKINTVEKRLYIFPVLPKIRLLGDIFPGNSMNIRKNKIFVRRTDKKRGLLNNLMVFHPHQPQRARAVWIIICGFKIKCEKIHNEKF